MLKFMILLLIMYYFSWVYIIIILMLMSFSMLMMMYSSYLKFFFVNMFFYLDYISNLLVFLLLIIFIIMILSSYMIYFKNNMYMLFMYMCCNLVLILYMAFMFMNFFYFYIFFEASLIPTFFLIMMWGYQPERLYAGMYMLIYTILASLPLLVGMFIMYIMNNSMFMFFSNYFISLNYYWWLIMLMAFMVKMPLYIFHLWLPKAHVEAPVSGSVILAAILLKLGGYGIMRLSYMYMYMSFNLSMLFISISLWGMVMTSLICMRQIDIKSLIAYSSVGHMGMVVSGIMSSVDHGWWGSYLMIISHGIVSSGLFCLANMMYELSMTRSIMMMKGLILINPLISMMWFFMLCMNVGVPPFISLLSELMIIMSMLYINYFLLMIFLLSSLITMIYSMYLYISLNHGKLSVMLNYFMVYNSRNFLILWYLMFPMFFFFLSPNFIYY